MAVDPYVWIQTRDGSPTLWSNDLGECFRSVKGAFTESWNVFVQPALDFTKTNGLELQIGEFGLGPGTNWLLTQSVATLRKQPCSYFVIEHDTRSFDLGLIKWAESWPFVLQFLKGLDLAVSAEAIDGLKLADLIRPIIYPSLKAAQLANETAHVWYHDPFGFEVNPDGFELNTLQDCSALWKKPTIGLSYACNKGFQNVLNQLGAQVTTHTNTNPALKRQRLEFFWT